MAKHKSKIYILIFLIFLGLIITILTNIYLINSYMAKKKIEVKETNNSNNVENIEVIEEETEDEEEEIDYFTQIKNLENAILNGKSSKKIAYLTFDDGPYYNTYKVLDILDECNVKATFFTTSINGQNCYDKKSENCLLLYPEYVKRGHTIANHTFTHGISKGLYKNVDSFITAVKKQEEQVKNLTGGYVTNIVRFPGGSNQAKSLKEGIIAELRANNYGWIDWTAEDGDGKSLSSAAEAMENFKKTINENIEVVLFHDYNRYTTSILKDAINYLKDNGYELYPLFYESVMVNK